MTIGLFRRFRGLAIALVVLALSAGAVFAAAPVLNLTGSHDQDQALNQGDQGENEQGDDAAKDEDADSEQGDEAAEDEDAEDGAESEEAEAPEAPEAEAGDANEDTHGALVSAAAAMETPDGFVNHGEFVSCVAHMKDVTAADIDWTAVTPEACAEADAARDAAKAEKRAEKQAQKGTHGKGAEKRAEHAGGQ